MRIKQSIFVVLVFILLNLMSSTLNAQTQPGPNPLAFFPHTINVAPGQTKTIPLCVVQEGSGPGGSVNMIDGGYIIFRFGGGFGTLNSTSNLRIEPWFLSPSDPNAVSVGDLVVNTIPSVGKVTIEQDSGVTKTIPYRYSICIDVNWTAPSTAQEGILDTSNTLASLSTPYTREMEVFVSNAPTINTTDGTFSGTLTTTGVITSPWATTTGEFFGANQTNTFDTGFNQKAVTVGNGVTVKMSESTCVGGDTICGNNSYFDNGNNAQFGGPSVAIGYKSNAFGTNIGSFTVTKTAEGFAGGNHSEAWGLATFALGDGAKAMGRNSGNPNGPFFGNESLLGVDAGFADGNANTWLGGGGGGIDNNAVLLIHAYGGTITYNQHQGSISTMDNQAIIGATPDGTNLDLRHWWFGAGVQNTTPHDIDWHGTAGKGTDVQGANWSFAPGLSTGAASPASLTWQLSSPIGSGSMLQSNVDKLRLDGPTGNLILLNGASVQLGVGGPVISSSSTAPSGSCTNGSLTVNSSGGAGSTLFVCEGGSWIAK